MDFVGKKVRVNNKQLKFYLNDSYTCFDHPFNKNIESTYDKAIEACLMMAIFKDSFPGTILKQSTLTKHILIEFDTGYLAYFDPKDIIFSEE